ncbi:hypothetical protein QTQ03_18475 [Micromonospora sp. WMMA1363]|uniref:hypothetical protein n=1 Tax=Micromonospora sp. WMMA1363 TaxID=3053985 RepID=UPI00259CAF44|nr:hypothetical protein [Micromonospora sp. WMMA1363]MDM4721483.1 hypothetical protein [Micromonospora sp. WMMA1363]
MVKASELSGDESSWNWKQIKAAVNGGSEIARGDDGAREEARGVSDPESFFRMAQSFARVQATLALCREVTQVHSRAIAGEGRPWQGHSADAFSSSMAWTVGVLDAHVDQITAGATEDRPEQGSIVESLVDAGNRLAYSRAVLDAIDHHYAAEARRLGVEPMDNGLIPVSKRPDIVAMMDRDMRAEFERLNEQYSMTVNDMRPPPPEELPAPRSPEPPSPPEIPNHPTTPAPEPPDLSTSPMDWNPSVSGPDPFPATELRGLADSPAIDTSGTDLSAGLRGFSVPPADDPNGPDLASIEAPLSSFTHSPDIGGHPETSFAPSTTLAGADTLTGPNAFPGSTVPPGSPTGIGPLPGGGGSSHITPMNHGAPVPVGVSS